MSKIPTLRNNIPVNRTAANVIKPGVHFDVKIPGNHRIWDKCPPIAPLPPLIERNPDFIDYTNVRYGRFVVVGYSAEYSRHGIFRAMSHHDRIKIDFKNRKRGRCRWIVRCACGNYELRASSAIKKAGPLDRCFICNKALQGRRSEFYRRHGHAPTKDEMTDW